ncbi:hypothetical protein [Paenibacillus sp. GXUN7292]|uniref:hypothetical protein n=1 Tax=Paenibacillus sp. GXUN7292 TaxID=3422499 RepID=UPI003D7CA98A
MYRNFIQKHKQFGSIPVFAGGVWTWLGMCTHYSRTFRCSEAALATCKEEGIREVFITSWGDNGAENNIWSALPGLQFFAEHAYMLDFDQSKYERRLEFCTNIPLDHYLIIEKLDDIAGMDIDPLDFSNPSKYLLWQDVLLGLFDRHVEGLALAEHYKLLEGEISKRMDCCSISRRVLELPSKLCGVLGMKADMGIRLKKAYDSADGEMLSFIVDQEIPELLVRLEELQETHYKLWMNAYKSFGWEVLDLRYGGELLD